MHKSFGEVVDLRPQTSQQELVPAVTPKRSPGLQPWFRFGEYFTRDDWIESFGLNLDRINERAANAYLEGEAAFFAPDAEDYIPAIAVGMQCALATRQAKLESSRHNFILAATNLCQSPIEQLMLASLCWTKWSAQRRLVEIWDSTGAIAKPETATVIAPQYKIEGHRVDFAIFVNVFADEEIKISIECDGHWHEQSKEQAARDKRQQNAVTFAGFRPQRFTGSDIWRDHKACAAQVSKLVANEIEAQLRRRGLK
jgi:very-short-patch-repair endonuclease